jgi:adenylate cyclase
VVEGLEELLLLRPLGRFQFVGKTEGLPIVEILSTRAGAEPEQQVLCEQFAVALEAFQQGQWDRASDTFGDILRHSTDDGPAQFFRSRSQRHRQGEMVPEDPGVVRMEAK